MKRVTSIAVMQKLAREIKQKNTIALVPTMGFLHEGHLSLVRLAIKKADVVIVTIFVNPTQFGPHEDFQKYPRDTNSDLQKLGKLDVDYVFVPTSESMYPEGHQTSVGVSRLTQPLCGKSRPGHFDGVALVVNKLFNITQPDFAVFGLKDYQQLVVIERLVKDLNMPITIVRGKTIREKDGLAMSSRNAYLNPQERQLAKALNRGLSKIKKVCANGACTVLQMKTQFYSEIPDDHRVRVDYLEVLDANRLTLIKKYQRNNTLVAAAVFVGKTRLIDNLVF
ncbi:MAG: pantoate-beta-alanine ligase [uncultured bacterium]|nr:MAG: pantoate-beta-alanine ligase [uncultured bacterium]HLD44592.1 pantoate--beta-alanine ligase [bacterium]